MKAGATMAISQSLIDTFNILFDRVATKLNSEPVDIDINGISTYALPVMDGHNDRIVIAELSAKHLNITKASIDKDGSFFYLIESNGEIKIFLSKLRFRW